MCVYFEYLCIFMNTYVCICVKLCIHPYMYVYKHRHTCMHAYINVCVSIYVRLLLCYLSQVKKYLKGVKVMTPHTKMIHRIVGFSPCSCAEQT